MDGMEKARVIFILKPGKSSYTKAKAYSPICLSSFLLKTLERLVDRHIRDDLLGRNSLHINYMPINRADPLIQHY